MLRAASLAVVGLAAVGLGAQPPAAAPAVAAFDQRVAELAQPFVAADRRHGVVVGLLRGEQTSVLAFGRPSQKSARELDADSVFEIGSVTKAFTGILLAMMVHEGSVALDDTAQSLLPAGSTLPRTAEREISLADLATHFSALPRLPDNLPGTPLDPYAGYTADAMYEFLARCEPKREIGSAYEYSNLGMGLLGHLLARRAGTEYAALVADRIAAPLGLGATAFALDDAQRARLARGHLANGIPTLNWELAVLAPAGGLRSSARDLLAFVAACVAPGDGAFAQAVALATRPRREVQPGLQIGLGWHVSGTGAEELVWHNGATGGYCSFVGFRPASREGIVVLSNRQRAGDAIPEKLAHEVLRLAAQDAPR